MPESPVFAKKRTISELSQQPPILTSSEVRKHWDKHIHVQISQNRRYSKSAGANNDDDQVGDINLILFLNT